VALVAGEGGFFEDGFGLGDEAVAQARLLLHEASDLGLEASVGLLALDGRGAGNDERRAGLVHEDGVNLIHNTEPVIALHLVVLAGGHAVVAQVVETELGGGAVGDVAAIHLAAQIGRHLLLDAADGQAEETVEVAHPLGVAAREVVVDRDELGVATREGV
jgi:hypothetical protein